MQTLKDLRERLRVTGPIRDRYLPLPGASGPVVVQGGPSVGAAASGKPQIVVKQTVKQVVGDTKRRKKAVKTSNRQVLKTKRKEYNTTKKAVKKALSVAKSAQYARENDKIKKMERGERKAARKKLREMLKARYASLLKQLPSSNKMSYGDIASLISKIKTVKW